MNTTPYKQVDGLDKKYKPLILKWLCKQFGYNDYPHSFKDQWITWHIWEGMLTVSFDSRQVEQDKLLSLITPRFRGCPQYKTLQIVNEDTFYLELKHLVYPQYPQITGNKLITSTKHRDNDGDDFYTYDWEVFLDDNTSIMYHNQKDTMDMKRRDYIYDCTIQQRAFTAFLDNFSQSNS